MTYRAMFLNIFMSVACCIYSPILIAGQQKTGMPQMQDFEKELEEANRAIEEFVASLPPAEQAEFNRQVEEMSRMFENMSEDEFEKFLGEMFTEEPTTEPNPFEAIQPVPQEAVEVISLNAEDKKKVETALKVLDDIIKQSELFMVIINSNPELPNRISRWGTKGAVSNWQTGTNWNSFKLELETLIQKLYKAEEQNLDTKKYKYLLELIADEALYNNLIQLQTSLNTLVPTINLPEFSIQKLSEQTKTTIKDILQKYTESFYLLTIPKSLDTLFEKYAPEEEKIRSAEEAANKRSLEAARGTRYPASSEGAGVEAGSMGYDYGYGYPQYYGGDYNPYDSYGQYGNDYGYSPDYGSYGSDTGTGAGKSSGGGAGGGGGSRGGGDKENKEDENDKNKNNKDQVSFTPNSEIEDAIGEFKTGLGDIKAAMMDKEGPSKLAKLVDTINEPDVDIILAGSTLPKIVDKKLDAMVKAFETIDQKKLNTTDLSHYQGKVRKIFEKNKKELETLRDAINTFGTEEDIKAEQREARRQHLSSDKIVPKTDIASLSKEKQWAYFGGKDLPAGNAADKLEKDIGTPVSLLEIKKKINKIFDDVKKFTGKKSDIPAASKKKEEAPKPTPEEVPSTE